MSNLKELEERLESLRSAIDTVSVNAIIKISKKVDERVLEMKLDENQKKLVTLLCEVVPMVAESSLSVKKLNREYWKLRDEIDRVRHEEVSDYSNVNVVVAFPNKEMEDVKFTMTYSEYSHLSEENAKKKRILEIISHASNALRDELGYRSRLLMDESTKEEPLKRKYTISLEDKDGKKLEKEINAEIKYSFS